MIRIAVIITLFFGCCLSNFAQHVISPAFSFGPFAGLHNPAIAQYEKMYVTLPSFSFNYGNNAFSYIDLIDRTDKDRPRLAPQNAIENLNDKNKIQVQLDLDFIRFGIKKGPVFFGFSAAENIDIQLDFPKELGLLAWYGNQQYLGREVEIGPAFSADYYREFALHLGAEIKNHSIGLRARYLSGLANARTAINSATVYTDTLYYQLTLTNDYKITTSGIDNFLNDPLSSFLTSGNPGVPRSGHRHRLFRSVSRSFAS